MKKYLLLALAGLLILLPVSSFSYPQGYTSDNMYVTGAGLFKLGDKQYCIVGGKIGDTSYNHLMSNDGGVSWTGESSGYAYNCDTGQSNNYIFTVKTQVAGTYEALFCSWASKSDNYTNWNYAPYLINGYDLKYPSVAGVFDNDIAVISVSEYDHNTGSFAGGIIYTLDPKTSHFAQLFGNVNGFTGEIDPCGQREQIRLGNGKDSNTLCYITYRDSINGKIAVGKIISTDGGITYRIYTYTPPSALDSILANCYKPDVESFNNIPYFSASQRNGSTFTTYCFSPSNWSSGWQTKSFTFPAGFRLNYPHARVCLGGTAVFVNPETHNLETTNSTTLMNNVLFSETYIPNYYNWGGFCEDAICYYGNYLAKNKFKRMDSTPPNCDRLGIIGGNATNSSFKMKFVNPNDDWSLTDKTGDSNNGIPYEKGVTKIANIEYKVDNGVWVKACNDLTGSPYEFTFDISDKPDGVYKFRGDIYDTAGNVRENYGENEGIVPIDEEGNPKGDPGNIIIDRVAPVSSIFTSPALKDGWVNKPPKVTIVATDNLSGVERTEYKINDGNWNTYTAPFNLPEGMYKVYYKSIDKAGNPESQKLQEIKVDTTPPNVSITSPSSDNIEVGFEEKQTVKVSGFASDNYLVSKMTLYIDGKKVAEKNIDKQSGTIDYAWDVTGLKQGKIHTIKIVAEDKAGNTTESEGGAGTKNVYVGSTPCYDWYFAEGNTLPEFEEWLSILNPTDAGTKTQYKFILDDGKVLTLDEVIPAHTRRTIKVADVLGNLREIAPHSGVSVFIHSYDKPVIAERPMYFLYKGSIKGGHTTKGINVLQKEYYFAEGSTRTQDTGGPFEPWITIQNPEDSPADVTLTYMLSNGENKDSHIQIPPHTRYTQNCVTDVGYEQDFSVKVTSSVPIAVERPMYFNFWNGVAQDGHDVTGVPQPSTTWEIAEGNTRQEFLMYICVQNPNNVTADVKFEFLSDKGEKTVFNRKVQPKSRYTESIFNVVPTDRDFSTCVTSNVPIVVEHPIYFQYRGVWNGGHNETGNTECYKSIYVAEGCTYSDTVTYYTIGNPNDDPANVTVSFMTGSGEVTNKTYNMLAHSRLTINVNDTIGPDKDVSAKITSDKPIMVDRPMYFDYHGKYTGGSLASGLGIEGGQ